MKRVILTAAVLAMLVVSVLTGTTIDPAHPYAYSANAGWLSVTGDTAHGASIGQSYCTGYVWSANCGWIGLGNGPTNGWRYSNTSAADWGVNHDGAGQLTGYAYGANIGWIAFEQTQGQPRIDLSTGNLSGYAWGANVGWIGLSNVEAYVRTARLDAGPDSDGDGLPDAWEREHANTLAALWGGRHDADGDGAPDAGEYGAGTDPLNPADNLKIVSLKVSLDTNTVLWTTSPTRLYRLEATNNLKNASSAWLDVGPGLMGPLSASPTGTIVTGVAETTRYYRVRAVIPLSE